MKLSYRWLSRHVDLEGIEPAELAEKLTLHVAEVEGVEPFAPQLSAVTVGHVVQREKHPDADKLSVCQVDLGDGRPVQIVCGAPNVDAGQRVAVATPGSELPGDVKIKKGKIRGQESNGMICSVRELDLGDEHDGIWVLPGEPEIGRPVAEALGLSDWVFEIDNKSITHRGDLWGHRGFAREIAAIYGRELKPLDTSLPPTGSGQACPVRIDDARCSRYLALPISGVEVSGSPDWLRYLLLAVGQRPLDVLVDVSNFVMLDLGQPNHLFDAGQVSAGIEVRAAREGEALETLDGLERRLAPDDLLICSGGQPVALAGVMGGAASKVERGTTELLLEVANFHGVTVRRTAARLGLRTDASARFEKSLDPKLALDAAGHLVRTLAAIQPSLTLPAPLTDVGDWQDPSREIELDLQAVRGLLGHPIDDAGISQRLAALGFGVRSSAGSLTVSVPSFRATKDITTPEDLIEEVGRSLGYDNLPGRSLEAEVAPPPYDGRRQLVRAISDRLSGAARFCEAPGYSFQSEALTRAVRESDAAFVRVVNPVAEGESRVRRSVVPALLAKLASNATHAARVPLFEVGKGYLPEERNERGEPREVHQAGVGLAAVKSAGKPSASVRFDEGALPELRGVLDDLLRHLGLEAEPWRRAEGELPGWAHPGRVVERCTRAGRLVLLAAVDPRVARDLDLDADAAAAVVDLDVALASAGEVRRYQPVPRFPSVKLDVAFSAPEAYPAGDLAAWIERAGKGLVAGVELFDVYRGESLGEGQKSLAWHVVLQAQDRTLSDKDQAKFLDRLARSVERDGVELRRE